MSSVLASLFSQNPCPLAAPHSARELCSVFRPLHRYIGSQPAVDFRQTSGYGHLRNCIPDTQAFEEASGKKCRYKVAPRRGGDATAVWAATETAEQVILVSLAILSVQSSER